MRIKLLLLLTMTMLCVGGFKPVTAKKAVVKIVQGKGKDDGFRLSVKNGQIVVEGHNGRGTAYGLLELSRMAGRPHHLRPVDARFQART